MPENSGRFIVDALFGKCERNKLVAECERNTSVSDKYAG